MEITIIVAGILIAIVLSNVINNLFPRLPLPILQIAVGALLSVFLLRDSLELEPDLFLVLVIAPLLFREADEANLSSMWKMKKPVLFMAFLLVFLTVFAIGFSVKWFVPTIPLAACFALGAILGPTDAVAVSTLASRISIPEHLRAILKGEGLLNDASGIIAFKFAVAALLTEHFSAPIAVGQLLIVAIGGCVVGFILSSIELSIVNMLKKLSVRHTATFVLIELMTPFLCYLVAEAFGVSGILAAVIAGSRQTPRLRRADPLEASISASKHTIWDILTFGLNSLVFLLLGLQLPKIVEDVFDSPDYTLQFMVGISVALTVILFVVRFVSVIIPFSDIMGKKAREKARNAVVVTLSGVKGTVSLAFAFALPIVYDNGEPFADHPAMMFMTACVIILSLLSALVFLPRIADAPQNSETSNELEIDILRETILQIRAQESARVADTLTSVYKKRIEKIEYAEYKRDERKKLRVLRAFMYHVERAELVGLRERKEIDSQIFRFAQELLLFSYRSEVPAVAVRAALFRAGRSFRHNRRDMTQSGTKDYLRRVSDIFDANADVVVRALNSKRGQGYPGKLINRLIRERIDFTSQIRDGMSARSLYARISQSHENDVLRGFYIERRVIHQFLETGKITAEQANDLRVNVNALESHILSGNRDEVVAEINEMVSSWQK